MARRIRESGYRLTLWARRPDSLEPFSEMDVQVGGTPAEVGGASDVVGICVVSDADVEQVVLGAQGLLAGMSEGGTIAIHSTVHPETCLELAEKAAEVGVAVVDAPVSGGAAAAEQRLLVMVGGQKRDVERCRPVFETFGNPVAHLGPLGSGELAKLLNNLVFVAQIGAALETFSSAEALGVEPTVLADVLSHGSGGSRAQVILAATNFDLTGLRHASALLQKDIDIVVDVFRTRDIPAPSRLLELARQTLEILKHAA
jgi:3-hydroxyisobutyrate dehydrogenase